VPTVVEAGYSGPRPAPRLYGHLINPATNEVLKEIQKRFGILGARPDPDTTASFAAREEKEAKFWTDTAKLINFQPQ